MKRIIVLGKELKVKLSPSFITNAACPLYLKRHYVDRVDELYVRVAAERGRAAHAAIAELIKICEDQELQPADLTTETICEAIRNHTPHTILSEIGLIFEWLKLWAERYKISDNIYGYEERIALDDDYDDCAWEEASYRGILDIIDVTGRHCRVTDWKSQPHILSQTDLEAHEQLTFYCWLASKLYPDIETFTARLWYLRYGFYAETQRTLEQLDIFENALLIKEGKIGEIDNWDPIPGKHCQYCDFVHMCPLANDLGSENNEVISQEQAIQTAQRITVMEALLKELKPKLKAYVGANDDVRIGDKWVWGFHHLVSDSWPVTKVEEVLEAHDRKLSEVANADARKMKKLLKEAAREDPVLEGELEAMREENHSTRFEGHELK